MIIAEGPDGTGKSTLVAHLADKFGLSIAQRGTKNRDELYKVTRPDTYRALACAVQANAPPLIWDRLGLPSEFVYHDLVGRPCEFKSREEQFILEVMNALQMPMIVCIVPHSLALENCTKDHQMKGVAENFDSIWSRYANRTFPHPTNTIFYDYTGTMGYASLEDVEEEVAGYLETRKVREC